MDGGSAGGSSGGEKYRGMDPHGDEPIILFSEKISGCGGGPAN